VNELSLALDGTADETTEGVAEWFGMPRLYMLAVEDRDGRLVGYGDTHANSDERTKWWVDVRELPGSSRASELLVPELERHVAEASPPAPLVRATVSAQNDAGRSVFVASGYTPIRSSYRMGIELSERSPAPGWPEGLAVRTLRPGEDERPVYEAHMDAFTDHWDFERAPYEEWRTWHTDRESFEPSLWFLVEEGTEIAAVCLCRSDHTFEPPRGWIGELGVRRQWRRRGLGLALLQHAFGEFHDRGLRNAGLGVDAENTTGAVRLYERAGMHVVSRMDTLEKTL